MNHLKTWTANLSGNEKEELVSQLKACQPVLDRLSSILDQRTEASVSKQLSSVTYESPSWALVQADAIGYQRALKEIRELLKERG